MAFRKGGLHLAADGQSLEFVGQGCQLPMTKFTELFTTPPDLQ